MPELSRFFDRLENTQNFDRFVNTWWDGRLYHYPGSCIRRGKEVTAKLICLIRDDVLCEACDYNIAATVNGDHDLENFRYLANIHTIIHDPAGAPTNERFAALEAFVNHAATLESNSTPAPTWSIELKQGAWRTLQSLTRQLTSEPYRMLALYHALCGDEKQREEIYCLYQSTAILASREAYRPREDKEPLEEYQRDISQHHMIRAALKEVEPSLGEHMDDSTHVLFAVPAGAVDYQDCALPILAYQRASTATSYLLYGPPVIRDYLGATLLDMWEDGLGVTSARVEPDQLETIIDLWKPEDPILGNLDHLVEAAV